MNKYQEACKDILHYLTVIYEDYGIDYRDEFEILDEAVNKSGKYDELQKVYFKNEPMESADLNGVKLQELYDFNSKLIDKATPKKPVRFKDKFYISPPKCPVCKTIPHICTQKYCDECGQKLDWSDEVVEVEDNG